MKKCYLLFTILLISVTTFAQYTFTTSSGTYQSLVNPTSLTNNAIWNTNTNYPLLFNFNFNINGQIITALTVQAGGGLSFPGLGTKTLRVFSHPDSGYLLNNRDSNNAVSPISYKITGATGQRILKIQWENAGFRDWCSTSYASDYVNFQIWLYESTGRIETHFGSSVSTNGSYGMPSCNSGVDGTQFLFRFNSCNPALSLTGPAQLPSYNYRDHCFWQPGIHINGTPSSGTIYQLNQTATSIDEVALSQVRLFPNPVRNSLKISHLPKDFEIRDILILDITGKVCSSKLIPLKARDHHSIDLQQLENGIYFIQLTGTDDSTIRKRFIMASNE